LTPFPPGEEASAGNKREPVKARKRRKKKKLNMRAKGPFSRFIWQTTLAFKREINTDMAKKSV